MTLVPLYWAPHSAKETNSKQVCPTCAFFSPNSTHTETHTHTHRVTVLKLTVPISWRLSVHKELSSASSSSIAFSVWTALLAGRWTVLRLLLFHTGRREHLAHVKSSTGKNVCSFCSRSGVAGSKGVTPTLWLLGWILGAFHNPGADTSLLCLHPGSV